MFQIEVINKETNCSIETKDISHIQSEYGRNLMLVIYRAKFTDKFLMGHRIEINNGYEPEQENENPIKERVGNIIEMNNFYH